MLLFISLKFFRKHCKRGRVKKFYYNFFLKPFSPEKKSYLKEKQNHLQNYTCLSISPIQIPLL